MKRLARARLSASFLAASMLACPSKSEPPPHRPSEAPGSQPGSMPSAKSPASLSLPTILTASVAPALVRQHVEVLASDVFEGRGAATKGIELAAAYIERNLRELRLAPAFGDSFRQPFELEVGVELGAKSRLRLGGKGLGLGRDFSPLTFSSTGTCSGGLAFVGFGIRAPELGYDDYAGIEPRERIVVFFEDEPGETDPESPFDGKKPTRHASLRGKILQARELGAKAALVIRDKLPRAGLRGPESDAGLISLAVTPAAASKLLGFDVLAERKRIDADYRPRSKEKLDRVVDIAADVVRRRLENNNLAGMLIPPSGGTHEVIVVGAHYDHLGMGGESSLSGRDTPEIHNGADDNASGVAAVLEAARSLVADPSGLRRTIIFVLFAGEESGLLGSQHFVEHPPVKMENIAFMLNLDMVGHLRGQRFDVMGSDSAEGLGEIITALAKGRGLVAQLGKGAVGPSDHTAFYTRHVPVAFLFTGAHEHYHRPSDDIDTLDYAGLATMSGLAADLTRALATTEARPTYVRVEEPSHAATGRGYGPSFGSIPEFGAPVSGVKLSGVRAGSPAEKAGVKGGDTIIEFDGVKVMNLTDFTEVLRSKAPGDQVSVKVKRGEETLELKATLERRERKD